MRYSACEKLEIILLVERSSLSVRRTLAPLGIPRSTFYGWYRRYAEGGVKAKDLIASPAFIVLQAADRFQHPTTRVNQL